MTYRKLIYIVDDEQDMLALTTQYLESLGYDVMTFTQGHEALAAVETSKRPVSLVLTDMVMPNMTGTSLITLLKTRVPSMRIVLMTGFFDQSIVKELIQETGVPLLKKPFTLEQLGTLVKQVLAE